MMHTRCCESETLKEEVSLVVSPDLKERLDLKERRRSLSSPSFKEEPRRFFNSPGFKERRRMRAPLIPPFFTEESLGCSAESLGCSASLSSIFVSNFCA